MNYILYNFICFFTIYQYYCIAQGNDEIKRFIIEDDFKHAIFGSNKFNPILQVFQDLNEIKESSSNNTAPNGNKTGENGAASTVQHSQKTMLRQHVTFITMKPTEWWARPNLRSQNFSITRSF